MRLPGVYRKLFWKSMRCDHFDTFSYLLLNVSLLSCNTQRAKLNAQNNSSNDKMMWMRFTISRQKKNKNNMREGFPCVNEMTSTQLTAVRSKSFIIDRNDEIWNVEWNTHCSRQTIYDQLFWKLHIFSTHGMGHE